MLHGKLDINEFIANVLIFLLVFSLVKIYAVKIVSLDGGIEIINGKSDCQLSFLASGAYKA